MSDQITKSEAAARAINRGRRTLAYADPQDRYRQLLARLEAEKELKKAAEVAKAPPNLRRAAREAIPEYEPGEKTSSERQAMLDVLHNPKSINVEASEQRVDAIVKAGIAPLALDAANSAQSQNSFDTMISHQVALAHRLLMELGTRALDEELDVADRVRLANSAARLMQGCQEGYLVLLKAKTNGRQTVVVQHINVADGAQAVVAGSIRGTRGRKAGGGQK